MAGQPGSDHGQAPLSTRRAPGEEVVVQEVWNGAVWAARPMTVVRDEEDFVALWHAKGTRWKAPTAPGARVGDETRGERFAGCLARGEWIFVDAVWELSTLVLMPAGEWHAIWVSWLDSGEQWGWYVNLQKPFRRTAKGFETMDLVLDVLVENDRTWRWKDEDELETFVSHGVFDMALAARVRDEGLRVAARAERNEAPFDEPWGDWRPDPSWQVPELPVGWDEPCR